MASLVVTPGVVTTVTLNRPEVRNALDAETIGQLGAWAAQLPVDGTVRVVVLRGAGPVFSAGADLAWMSAMVNQTREENLADARRAAETFLALDTLPVPVVARVQGAAFGGGAGLLAVADLVVAAEDATFGFTETRLGIVPAMIGPFVVRKIGLSAARALCLGGIRFSAARARELGLVHDVVAPGDLDAAVARHVEEFLKAGPTAIAATKRLLRDVAGRTPEDVLALAVEVIATQRTSAEGQEGMRAFLEKRPPKW